MCTKKKYNYKIKILYSYSNEFGKETKRIEVIEIFDNMNNLKQSLFFDHDNTGNLFAIANPKYNKAINKITKIETDHFDMEDGQFIGTFLDKEYKYNEKWEMIDERRYISDKVREVCKYDNFGHIIEEIEYTEDGAIKELKKNIYKNKLLIKEIKYSEDGAIKELKKNIYKNKLLTTEIFYTGKEGEKGIEVKKYNHKYNKKNEIIKSFRVNWRRETIIITYKRKYNNKGYKTEETMFFQNPNEIKQISYEHKYKYNKFGDLVEKVNCLDDNHYLKEIYKYALTPF